MSDDMNLLEETVRVLAKHGKTPQDVRFVLSWTDRWPRESISEWCTWEEFSSQADVIYDSGYGGEMVAVELKIVGDDWWLERGTYDGSEWWEYKSLPGKPARHNSELPVWSDIAIEPMSERNSVR